MKNLLLQALVAGALCRCAVHAALPTLAAAVASVAAAAALLLLLQLLLTLMFQPPPPSLVPLALAATSTPA